MLENEKNDNTNNDTFNTYPNYHWILKSFYTRRKMDVMVGDGNGGKKHKKKNGSDGGW